MVPNLPSLQIPTSLTIDYTYDALNRMVSATYSDGRSFGYTYDPAGNVLQLQQNLGPGTVTTTYAYNPANELLTAQVDGTTWNYSYDANGSLTEVLPNGNPGTGAKRYTYNAAGNLMQVEAHNGSAWSTQAEMDYNGLGQRLSMDAAGVIAHYVMDGDRPLTAESSGNTTYYLYGLGAIGEKTTAWNYSLTDGTGTPRQLTNDLAEITLTSRYTPWGDTLETFGTGNFTFGYLGGVLDATTGLLYVGNGQYYDPASGRFLTRNVNPDGTNPYVPWNPIGAVVGPLGLIALVFGRKKKGSKVGTFLVLVLVVGSVGMTLAGCSGEPTEVTAVFTPDGTATITFDATTVVAPIASVTEAVNIDITDTPCPPILLPTETATPTKGVRDQLNESLLEPFYRTVNTMASGMDYYGWYKNLWDNDGFWWWQEHNSFTIWDFITLVLYLELDTVGNPDYQAYQGFNIYREAIVRVVYQDAKTFGYVGGSPEATLNWLAGYSESGAYYDKLPVRKHGLCCMGVPELKFNPYSSAEVLVNTIRFPENYGASEWTLGLRTNAPYGVGNRSLFESDPLKEKALNYAESHNMISWSSSKEDGSGQVIIPTGCGSYLLSLDNKNYERLCGTWPLE